MFGIGCWKYAPEAAEKLLIKAGLEKEDRRLVLQGRALHHYPNLPGWKPSIRAGRGVQSAYDQLTKFGLNCTLLQESDATWNTNCSTGNY